MRKAQEQDRKRLGEINKKFAKVINDDFFGHAYELNAFVLV